MLYGSETWCLKENEMSILRRTERAMVRAMCGVKLKERESSEELMDRLGLRERVEQLAKANGVRWYGHVLRREKDDVLRRALAFEVDGVRRRGRPKKTWKKQVEEDIKKIKLNKEDAPNRGKWRNGVEKIAREMRCIRPPSLTGTKPDQNWSWMDGWMDTYSQSA